MSFQSLLKKHVVPLEYERNTAVDQGMDPVDGKGRGESPDPRDQLRDAPQPDQDLDEVWSAASDDRDPFSLVDFSTEEVKHIPTMLEADYRGIGELLPKLPKVQRRAILTQALTGTRYSEIKRRGAEDFDLEAGIYTIGHDRTGGKRAKNKNSVRKIPFSPELVEELKGFDWQWPILAVVNKKIKWVNPELSRHPFRHGVVRLSRELGGDVDVTEASVGHSMGGMKDVYGDGYFVERFREMLTPVWNQIIGVVQLATTGPDGLSATHDQC